MSRIRNRKQRPAEKRRAEALQGGEGKAGDLSGSPAASGEYRPPGRFERWGVPGLVISVVLLVFNFLHDEDRRLQQQIEVERRRVDSVLAIREELRRLQAELKVSNARQFDAWCKGHDGVYVRGEEICRLKDGTEIPYHPPFPVSDQMQGQGR